MGRGSNRAKGNAKPAPRKSQKHQDARVRDLAEALQREAEASTRVAEADG
jgi:hypothetical protein